MRSKILVVDPSVAGISGDMIVAAAIDLGADQKGTIDAMLSAKKHLRGCSKLEIIVSNVVKHGFRAKHLVVGAEESVHERRADEMLDAMKDALSSLGLSKKAADFALNSLKTLVDVEGKVHDENAGMVHLHEAGSIDTLVDILGATYAFNDLRILNDAKVVTTPIAVGGGTFAFSHGRVSSPSPAVLEIARHYKLPIVGGPVEAELATPTGVSILANLIDGSVKFYPAMKPLAVGLGAGTRDFEGVPNILRLTLAEPLAELPAEEIVILETNLDDITGEHLAHASEILVNEGAKDVAVIQTIGKKGRPGYLLRVITETTKAEELVERMMVETGTLGVRMTTSIRHVASREVVPISVQLKGRRVTVGVKVSRNARGEIIAIKPEYKEIRELARKLSIPLRRLSDEIVSSAKLKIARKENRP